MFKPMIRSRHKSHDLLRKVLPTLKFKSVVRLGSTTDFSDTKTNGGKRIEINTIEGVKNSASKLRMKECFTKASVKTADWWTSETHITFVKGDKSGTATVDTLPYPIVAKHIFGSRGTGNTLINSKRELENWITGKNLSNYIFENFVPYVKEYRLHVSKDGCFYSCRKMLKSDTPSGKRWYRNDSNSVWILETNPLFNKPSNWKTIEEECVKALNAVGLDVCACDVKVQSEKDSTKEPNFIIIETNSAPSFADITLEKYKILIPNLLNDKYEKG